MRIPRTPDPAPGALATGPLFVLAVVLAALRWLAWLAAPFVLLAAITVAANLADIAIKTTAHYLFASSEAPPRSQTH